MRAGKGWAWEYKAAATDRSDGTVDQGEEVNLPCSSDHHFIFLVSVSLELKQN